MLGILQLFTASPSALFDRLEDAWTEHASCYAADMRGWPGHVRECQHIVETTNRFPCLVTIGRSSDAGTWTQQVWRFCESAVVDEQRVYRTYGTLPDRQWEVTPLGEFGDTSVASTLDN